jgi:hypothetical protein
MRTLTTVPGTLLLAAALVLAWPAAAQPALPTAAGAQEMTPSASMGTAEGVAMAETLSTATWMAGGFAGGLVLGPIGAGLAWALAGGSESALPEALERQVRQEDRDYQLAYQRAFTAEVRARRQQAAILGGTAGTVVLGLLTYAAYQYTR